MYLACILVISFLLSSPTAPQQTPSGNADAASQAPSSAPVVSPQPSTADAQEPAKPVAVPKKAQSGKSASSAPGKACQAKTDQTKSGKKSGTRKHATTAIPGGKPRKLVVREGSTNEPPAQIAPGMSQEQASHQRQSTGQLLASTESNLKQIAGRTLDANQQATVGQIRSYMVAARSALAGGDPERAHNLSSKAHLLSDDLLKH